MNGLQFTVYGLQLITWHAQIIGAESYLPVEVIICKL